MSRNDPPPSYQDSVPAGYTNYGAPQSGPPPAYGYGTQPTAPPQGYDPKTGRYQPVPSYPPQNVLVQPQQQIIVVGGCPSCRVGVLEDDFTCLGVCCAILFFPIGILCCLAMKQRHCPNCGAIFES